MPIFGKRILTAICGTSVASSKSTKTSAEGSTTEDTGLNPVAITCRRASTYTRDIDEIYKNTGIVIGVHTVFDGGRMRDA